MRDVDVYCDAVQPLHEVMCAAKLGTLTQAMAAEGWQGRPLLVVVDGDGYRGLTGSHRLAAARAAGLDRVPALVIDDADLDADQWEEVNTLLGWWEDDDKARWMREAGLDEAADLLDLEIAANAAE